MEWRSFFGGVDPKSILEPGRPNNGGDTPISCSMLRSAFVPVGGVGCTLPYGLDSMPSLTLVGLVRSRVNLHTIAGLLVRCSIWVTLISTRSPCKMQILYSRVFWLLDLSRYFAPFAFTYLLRSIAAKGFVESLDPWPSNPGISPDLSMWISLTSDVQWSDPEEKLTRVIRSNWNSV